MKRDFFFQENYQHAIYMARASMHPEGNGVRRAKPSLTRQALRVMHIMRIITRILHYQTCRKYVWRLNGQRRRGVLSTAPTLAATTS